LQKTGILTRIDRNGRIALTKKIRELVGWDHEMILEVMIDDNGNVVLAPHYRICVFCGKQTENSFYGKPLCEDCALKIVQSTKINIAEQ